MRPIIDENGARLVDDGGNTVPMVKSFSVHVEVDGTLTVSDCVFFASKDGKAIRCRGPER